MLSNTIIPSRPEGHRPEQWTPDVEREKLIDHREELVALVKGHKAEFKALLERRCNQGCGSAKAMWQTAAAIVQGQGQIAVIDLLLESLSTY